jgi:hypothetical protein
MAAGQDVTLRATQKPFLGAHLDWSHPLTKDLVACWALNQYGSSSITDLVNGFTMNLTGNPGAWGPGAFGGPALNLDGTTQWFDGPVIFKGKPPVRVSCSGWLRVPAGFPAGGYSPIFFCNRNLNRVFDLAINGNGIATFYDASNIPHQVEAGPNLTDQQWHYLAATWDGVPASGIVTLYADGLQVGQQVLAGNGSQPVADAAAIGKHTANGVNLASGGIDICSVWSRVLDPSEIMQLYSNPCAVFAQPSNQRYWVFIPPPPTVSAISVMAGPQSGGTAITITGTNFALSSPVSVTFGGIPASSVVMVNGTTITCVTPAFTGFGPMRVVVTVASQVSTQPIYFFVSAPLPIAGVAGTMPVLPIMQVIAPLPTQNDEPRDVALGAIDLALGSNNDLATVSGTAKATQEFMKLAKTALGRTMLFPAYGNVFAGMLGQPMPSDQEVQAALNGVKSFLLELQAKRLAAGGKVSTSEFIADVVAGQVQKDLLTGRVWVPITLVTGDGTQQPLDTTILGGTFGVAG